MFKNDFSLLSNETRSFINAADRLFINGTWQTCSQTIPVIDPSSGREFSRIGAGGSHEIDAAVAAARTAFEYGPWSKSSGAEREAVLRRLADLIERDKQILAELEVIDVGMPIWMARDLNVGGAVDALRYIAGFARRIEGRTVQVTPPIPNSAFFGYTQKEAVGVVGAIIPWNVPLMMSIWKLAPSLAAGCTLVLKPSEEASLSILYLANLAQEAGLPAGVLNIVSGFGPTAGAALAGHPDIDKITFTGSTSTGKIIARHAAENATKLTLELGGKSPQLLFADANLEKVIPGIAGSIFLNSGQVCVAGSRLYVEKNIYDEAVSRLSKYADAMQVGAGLNPTVQMGPLISLKQKRSVLQHLQVAQRAGAELLTANPEVEADGYYVRPTVVAVADQSAQIVKDEIFGPVITVTPFEDFEHAIELANDTQYGLSACLWTNNLSLVHHAIPKIRSGKVAVNTEPMPWPGLPEGGRSASGYGRDLGEESFESFLETKSVLIRYA